MSRKTRLLLVLATIAVAPVREGLAEPPVARVQPVAAPAPVDPAAALRTARQRLPTSSIAHPGNLDVPKGVLQPYEKPDGPTLVITPSTTVIASKARLWFMTMGGATQVSFATDVDALSVSHACYPWTEACTPSMMLLVAEYAYDASHGYLVNCFVTNGGTSNVEIAVDGPGSKYTIWAGHSAWLSRDYKPGSPPNSVGAAGWGGMILSSQAIPTATLYSVTRCEITPYTVVRGG